ncbi:MAG: hypothetical protein ABF812_16120 [Gluconobacter cerinus]|uniref:hypothetical protein n=1 Tax=Gluconobacter cerinus TaxID=38307 RepID=UPI0039E75DB8
MTARIMLILGITALSLAACSGAIRDHSDGPEAIKAKDQAFYAREKQDYSRDAANNPI